VAGCRPLTPDEIAALDAPGVFAGRYSRRDRALFTLGRYSGFRVRELLSLRVKDLMHPGGRFVERIHVERRNIKRKRQGRQIPFHPAARLAVRDWIKELFAAGHVGRNVCVFRSQKGRDEAMSVSQAWRVINRVFVRAGLDGKVATHSMRKTFAMGIYNKAQERQSAGEHIDPIRCAMHGLGHKSVATTERYLDFDAQLVEDLTLALP
jgi:integrase